jgi:hypothetical protein
MFMNYIITLICLLITLGCSSNQSVKEDEKTKKIDDVLSKKSIYVSRQKIIDSFSGQDSIKFFKDASWINLKGKNEIKDEKLNYPFICYTFYNGYFDMSFFFNSNRLIKWRIKEYSGFHFLHMKKYVAGDIQDTVHNYVFFKENENIFIDCSNNQVTSLDKIDIRSITKSSEIDSTSIKEQYFFTTWGKRLVSTTNAINFEKSILNKTFDIFGERNLNLQKGKLIRNYDYSKEFAKKEEVTKKEVFVMESGLQTESFIYYFVTRFSYMTIVM